MWLPLTALVLAAGPAGLTLATPGQRALLERGVALLREGDRLVRLGKREEAAQLALEALKIERRVFGVPRFSQAHLCESMAGWLEDRRRFDEANQLRAGALAALRLALPADHWRVIDARESLRLCLRMKGMPAEKLKRLDEALGAGAKARAAQAKGDLRAALEQSRRGAALMAEAVGEEHPLWATLRMNLGVAQHALGQYADARQSFEASTRVFERVLGPKHPRYAASLDSLGCVLSDLGERKQALALIDRALGIRIRALGVPHLDVAHSLSHLSAVLQNLGDYRTARLAAEQALNVRRALLKPDDPQVARSLEALSVLQRLMADYPAALRNARQALAIRSRKLGGGHPLTAQAHNSVGLVLAAMGKHPEARREYEKALAAYRELRLENTLGFAQALANFADTLRLEGRPREALVPAREAALAFRKMFGEGHSFHATALNNLGQVQNDLGDVEGALKIARRVLEIRTKALGDDHPETANSMHNLAALLSQTGEHFEATRLARRAVDKIRRAHGEKHPLYALALRSLANLYRARGDLALAHPLLQKAHAVRRAALGPAHPDTVLSLLDLAGLARMREEGKQARAYLKEAWEATKAGASRGHPLHTAVMAQLGALYQDEGHYEEALPLLAEVVRRRRAEGETHPKYATALLNLATLQAGRRRLSAALQLAQRGADLLDRVLGEASQEALDARGILAALWQQQGDERRAAAAAEVALERAKRQLGLAAGVQSERQQLGSALALRYALNLRLSLPGESYRHVLAWKGAVFARQARRLRQARLLAKEGPGETKGLLKRLDGIAREMAVAAAGGARARLEALAREREEVQERLALRSPAFREERSRKQASPAALAASLPDGVALVDYLFYVRHDHAQRLPSRRYRRRYAAFVVRKGRDVVRVELGPAGPIEEAAARWRGSLSSGGDGGRDGELLRRLLWGPLERHLAGASTVLVSPDEVVGSLPLGALPGAKPGAYLIEERALAVVPVPRSLLEAERGKRKDGLLVVSGLDYGRGAWAALPATAPEAKAVREAFAAHRPRAGVEELSGTRAGREALRRGLARAGAAHLATHGYFTGERRSALDGRLPGEVVSGWHPGVLSGLVLSGGEALTALEVAEEDLSGLELAVLSACETGLGKRSAGEGMLGLQRAFAVAGCKSVVSSLWSVHDAATSVLMERFYFHLWKKKLSKLEALRQAQLDVMRHPEWVEERVKRLAGLRGLRGVGKVSEKLVAGKKQRRSPLAWWAAWQLSGDWR